MPTRRLLGNFGSGSPFARLRQRGLLSVRIGELCRRVAVYQRSLPLYTCSTLLMGIVRAHAARTEAAHEHTQKVYEQVSRSALGLVHVPQQCKTASVSQITLEVVDVASALAYDPALAAVSHVWDSESACGKGVISGVRSSSPVASAGQSRDGTGECHSSPYGSIGADLPMLRDSSPRAFRSPSDRLDLGLEDCVTSVGGDNSSSPWSQLHDDSNARVGATSRAGVATHELAIEASEPLRWVSPGNSHKRQKLCPWDKECIYDAAQYYARQLRTVDASSYLMSARRPAIPPAELLQSSFGLGGSQLCAMTVDRRIASLERHFAALRRRSKELFIRANERRALTEEDPLDGKPSRGIETPAAYTTLIDTDVSFDADAVREVGRAATPPSDTHADLFPWTSLRDAHYDHLGWDDSYAGSNAYDADSVSLGRRSISMMSPEIPLGRRAPRISTLGMSPTHVTASPHLDAVCEPRVAETQYAEEQPSVADSTYDPDVPGHLSAATKDFSVYMRLVAQAIEAHRTLRFDDLVRQHDARTAAHAFSHLLALASEDAVRVVQRETFGPIYIHT